MWTSQKQLLLVRKALIEEEIICRLEGLLSDPFGIQGLQKSLPPLHSIQKRKIYIYILKYI